MKTNINGLLQGRITRWGSLAVLLIALGATVGWQNQKHYRFGGGWIGNDGTGLLWSVLQIPLDPAGRTAAIRVNAVGGGTGTGTEGTGEGEMVSRDTAKWTVVSYEKDPQHPLQISQIWVSVGTLKFTGADSFELNYTLSIFLADADADKDGFPDANASPVATIPGLTATGKRVPIP